MLTNGRWTCKNIDLMIWHALTIISGKLINSETWLGNYILSKYRRTINRIKVSAKVASWPKVKCESYKKVVRTYSYTGEWQNLTVKIKVVMTSYNTNVWKWHGHSCGEGSQWLACAAHLAGPRWDPAATSALFEGRKWCHQVESSLVAEMQCRSGCGCHIWSRARVVSQCFNKLGSWRVPIVVNLTQTLSFCFLVAWLVLRHDGSDSVFEV